MNKLIKGIRDAHYKKIFEENVKAGRKYYTVGPMMGQWLTDEEYEQKMIEYKRKKYN